MDAGIYNGLQIPLVRDSFILQCLIVSLSYTFFEGDFLWQEPFQFLISLNDTFSKNVYGAPLASIPQRPPQFWYLSRPTHSLETAISDQVAT